MYKGDDGELHVPLTTASDGIEWPASTSSLNLEEWTSDTHGIRGWVVYRAVLDAVLKENFQHRIEICSRNHNSPVTW
jgi:hypothetical protein